MAWELAASAGSRILTYASLGLYRRLREGTGLFVGKWDQLIYATDTDPEKRDIVVCRQHGNKVTGKIQRVIPTQDDKSRWNIVGRLFEQSLVGIFWSEDPGYISFGTFWLVHSGHHLYKGYYTKHRPLEREMERLADER
ncbi:MAG TPA: hypothetical protein VFQ39_18510, partial [Longimicrobium sp.]|nr:hypothetical protein [Longimicrobium sp.]